MPDLHEFDPDDDGICMHCEKGEAHHTAVCLCDYAGRECCPIHITAEDGAEWEAMA
jgi:hypothetical protein